jgi:hypothetical protein
MTGQFPAEAMPEDKFDFFPESFSGSGYGGVFHFQFAAR